MSETATTASATTASVTAGDSPSVAVVRSIYEALATGDVPALLARLHPEVEVDEPADLPYGGIHRGADDFLGSVLGVMMATAEVTLTRHELFDGGAGTVVGRLEGELTARSTGERFPLTMIEIHDVEGDVSRKIDVYLKNPAELAAFYARSAPAAAA